MKVRDGRHLMPQPDQDHRRFGWDQGAFASCSAVTVASHGVVIGAFEGSLVASLALSLATKAHAGQVDRSGRPYLEHVLRVAASVSPDAVPIALLHDILEDTKTRAKDLLAAGIPQAIVDAVQVLTRHPGGETYQDFIERIATSGDPLAIEVKLADLRDNMRPGGTPSLYERYVIATNRLEAVRRPEAA